MQNNVYDWFDQGLYTKYECKIKIIQLILFIMSIEINLYNICFNNFDTVNTRYNILSNVIMIN